jgi:hypothetical protein
MVEKSNKELMLGIVLGVSFLVVLVLMFSPLFRGENALQAADRLFNSIAKGSTYYIPDVMKRAERYQETKFEATIKLPDADFAAKAKKLLTEAGAECTGEGAELKSSGSLGALFQSALKDSAAMFQNKGSEISGKYGFQEKEVLLVWWRTFGLLEKDFRRQARFKEAAAVSEVMKKGVEVGYNFYGITPESAGSRWGILTLSLVFYVVYTLWWGMAIYFLFEGLGLKMTAGAKKEV